MDESTEQMTDVKVGEQTTPDTQAPVLKEWQHHIRHPREDMKQQSWCGVRLYNYDWCFQDSDHALLTVQNSERLQPCPACVDVLLGILATVVRA